MNGSIILDLVAASLLDVRVADAHQVLHDLDVALLAGDEQRRAAVLDPA